MRQMVFRFLCLSLAMIALSVLGAMAESTTVMVYVCGSNLETLYHSATKDINEIIASGFDTEANHVVVMAGGSRKWVDEYAFPADEANIYSFRKSKNDGSLKKTRLKADFENASMGSSETLTRFMKYCREHFDADRYALVLWDHGGGPLYGVCWDERFDNDHLSLDELDAALAQSPFAGEKLEWIGFDACLMSSVEVASKMAPYARYMIASQAEEPASGWNYAFLKGLEGDPDGAATGARIIDAYLNTPQKGQPDMTLSCVDLSQVGAVERRIDEMYAGMGMQLTEETFSRLAKLRVKATGFGRSNGAAMRGMDGYDLVDVVSLSACYASENERGVEGIREAVDRAVVKNGSNVPDSCGLSIYHPYRNQRKFLGEWQDTYARLSFCPGYTDYVNAYGRIMSGERLVKWNDLVNISATEDGSLVKLQLSPEQMANLASARLVVLSRNVYDLNDNAFFRVYSTDDVAVDGELLTARYDNTCLQILDETGMYALTGAVSYSVTESGSYQIRFYPIEQDKTRWSDPIIAEYTLDGEGCLQLKSFSVFDEMTQAYSSRVDLDFSRFMGLTFKNEYRVPTPGEGGEYPAFDLWTEDEHRDLQWKARVDIDRTAFMPSFALDSSAAEDLYAAYEITDTQGNTYMTELTHLGSGGVEAYAAEVGLDDDIPLAEPYACAWWDDRLAAFALTVMNTSDIKQKYMISDVTINGVAVEAAVGILDSGTEEGDLAPGEIGQIPLFLDSQVLDGAETGSSIKRLSGKLNVFAAEDGGASYAVGFTADMDFPLDALFHAEGEAGEDVEILPEDIAFTLPSMGDSPFVLKDLVIVRPSESSENSRILVNLLIPNDTQKDLNYLIDRVAINGTPIDVQAISAQGHGGLTALNRFSVAPGEEGAANIVLRYGDIATVAPDVSLRQLDFRLSMTSVTDGRTRFLYALPVTMKMDVPLDAFYGEIEGLPSQALVDYGETIGALNETNRLLLFNQEGRSAYLQGQFIVGRNLVLLLCCKNRTDRDARLFLGRAELDGKPAKMGQMCNPMVKVRNNRAKSLGLAVSDWKETTGVSIDLPKGESVYCYVSITPEAAEQDEAKSVAFSAYMYDAENPTQWTAVEQIEIVSEEPAPLREDIEGVAPASDFEVAIRGAEPGEGRALLDSRVRPLRGELPEPITLTLEMPEGERMESGYYVILRGVRSEKQLAGMNIVNDAREGAKNAVVSFADGREWLIYKAVGELKREDDGRRASAVYPCIEPVILSGEDRMPLDVTLVSVEDDGAIDLRQTGGIMTFGSTDYPGAVLPCGLGSVEVRYVPSEGRAELIDHRETADDDFSRAGIMCHDERMVPANADRETLAAFLNSDDPFALTRVLLLDGLPLTVAVEPLERPQDCYVVFFYKNTGGQVSCTLPQPLLAAQ